MSKKDQELESLMRQDPSLKKLYDATKEVYYADLAARRGIAGRGKLKKLREENKNNCEKIAMHSIKATILKKDGKIDLAIKELNEALKIDPDCLHTQRELENLKLRRR